MKKILMIGLVLTMFTPLLSVADDEKVCYTVIDPYHKTVKRVCVTI